MHILSSLYYLGVLVLFLGAVGLYLWLSLKTGTFSSYTVCVVSIMGAIVLGELSRELLVLFNGEAPALTHARAAILRMEHTWLGLFVGEVIHRAR